MDKTCLECGDTFRGRVDKKYCSDLCRNSYNNKLNSNIPDYVRNVNSILKKNRKILAKLTPSETSKAKRLKLQQHGFNFSYHTHVYTTKKGASYFFCYEYGYLPVDNEQLILVKSKEEEI